MPNFASAIEKQRIASGTLAQVVEQWTENPCVLGSTPRGTTPPFIGAALARGRSFFYLPVLPVFYLQQPICLFIRYRVVFESAYLWCPKYFVMLHNIVELSLCRGKVGI